MFFTNPRTEGNKYTADCCLPRQSTRGNSILAPHARLRWLDVSQTKFFTCFKRTPILFILLISAVLHWVAHISFPISRHDTVTPTDRINFTYPYISHRWSYHCVLLVYSNRGSWKQFFACAIVIVLSAKNSGNLVLLDCFCQNWWHFDNNSMDYELVGTV